jgi:hypothetical protein
MSPKIKRKQSLAGSSGFTITGPIGPWEDDEAAAVFTLVISQAVSGGMAVGIGKSQPYYPGATDWSADVTVLPGKSFKPGGATVFAWASIAEKDGGWEMYPWGRPVQLA